MTQATVGDRFQVVIPRAERNRLGLRARSRVDIQAAEGCLIVTPVDALKLRGIGKTLADKEDATDYVRRLRAEWETRT